jgi:hypothetical protein
MDFWSGLLIVAASVLLAWYGLGMLISRNIFARWFFYTKIVRGYEKEQLGKLRGETIYLNNFSQDPELGEDLYKILKLVGTKVHWSYINAIPPCWELSLISQQGNTLKFHLIFHRCFIDRNREIEVISPDPFLFLKNVIVPLVVVEKATA